MSRKRWTRKRLREKEDINLSLELNEKKSVIQQLSHHVMHLNPEMNLKS